ncbi:MAG: DNA mismatch repair endonuclease MutL, partial [Phaeodactylibacter sp.]|nr:DNA mismatch repair endonuclease MutL [Phaeodactylibacter sp.]
MADLIQLLPDAIANQIAAGEVIQRPASAVKELMENAIDAGATEIKLVVKDAGKTLIQVIDNGCGMSETDARMAFERHATSKIRAANDLFAIRTMGFRGEALASIAAIAHVEIKTRRHSDELGTRLVIEGSEVKSQEPCQCPQGTTISIKNLFYNVPARRNFLKSNPVEMRHINDEFQRIAIANSDIFFSLHHNDSEIFHLPAGKLRQRLIGVFGSASNKKLVPVSEETEVLRLQGYVGKPEFAKKTRGEQYFFVNNRYIKSAYLNHGLVSAYEELLPSGSYPLYVIFIDIDPKRIDINVHPTKQEIKFEDERLVYNYLRAAVRHALGQYNIMPSLDFDQDPTF